MIKILRVDERFVHGQVAFSWTNSLGANCILVANDEVASNRLQQKTLKMAAPSGVQFVIKGIDDAATALNGEKIKKYKVFVIVNSIKDALILASKSKEIQEVNLGNIKKKDNKKKVTSSIFLNESEVADLEALAKLDVEIECRAVPTDPKTNPLEIWRANYD